MPFFPFAVVQLRRSSRSAGSTPLGANGTTRNLATLGAQIESKTGGPLPATGEGKGLIGKPPRLRVERGSDKHAFFFFFVFCLSLPRFPTQRAGRTLPGKQRQLLAWVLAEDGREGE